MTETSASYNPDACCGSECNLLGAKPEEPCWGDVHQAGEYIGLDGDYEWAHECEGHSGCFDLGEGYKPEPVNQPPVGRNQVGGVIYVGNVSGGGK